MVDDPKEPTIDFQDWFDGGNVFFRSKDKQRFQYAVNAIIEGEMGLAVIGTNETVLDHYCRMLLARLREYDKFQLEILLPTDTENLLKRFNEMVEAMSIEQARKAPEENELLPVKLLIINDAKLVKDEQWALMERLLADFPGVNVRLVLFIDKTGCPNYEKPLGLFGRRLHRWVVETPSYTEAQQLFEAAQEHGYENAVGALLKDTGLGGAIDPLESNLDAPAEDLPEPTIEPQGEFDDEPEQSSSSGWGKAGLWIFTTVILGCAAVAWQVSNQLNEEPAVQVVPQPITELVEIPKADNLLANELQAQLKTPSFKQPPPEPEKPLEQEEKPALMAESAGSENVVSVSAPIEPQKPQSQLSLSARVRSPAIDSVRASAPSDFFVQYIVLSDRVEAVNFVSRYPALNNALLLPIQSQGSIVTAVIAGPFASRPEAEEFTQGTGLPADYWIRGAELLKSVVQAD